MLDKNDLKEVLSVALANGGDFADIFLEEKQTTGIGLEAGRIERVNSGLDAGAGIRVLSGEATAYAYTNDTSKQGLLAAAKIVSHAAQGGQKDLQLNLTTLKPLVDFQIKTRPGSVSTQAKVELVKRVEQAARAVDREKIKQVIVGYGDTVQKVTIANSEGTYVEDERVRTRLMVNVVAAENGNIQTGYDAIGSHAGFEIFDDCNPEQFARTAARRAVKMLTARPAPAGKMPVVMAGEAGGTMVHEACGHGLEADLEQRQLSVYAGKKGQPVASPLITVIDDATLPNRYGSYRFDDEGVPSRKVTLIEKGILTDYLYDRLTASKEKRESNGHGRRESYQHKPLPRMANTYIAPGKEDPEKIIKDYKSGLLVKKMGGGQVNTTTGDFVFDVAEGYLIQDGEIGPLVRGATLTGNGPEVLRLVERVGSDLGFTIGTCGKDGQGAPVSDAQPTMAIKELIVGGTAHGSGDKQLSRRLTAGYGKIRRI
ncbi:TldD/PmbA family protein [Desulfotomaculum varum]